MFETIFGLPVHVLVLHAVVVFLPVASLAVLTAAFWPKFRRWAGPGPLILSVLSTALVPVTTSSGEYLQMAIGAQDDPAVQLHQHLGDLLIYWAIGLVVAAGLVYWYHRQTRSPEARTPQRPVVIAIMAIAAVASIGTLIHVVRVGDSGARAAWAYVSEL